MKNIILIVSLVLIFNCLAAQNYLTEDAVWKELVYIEGEGMQHFELAIEGDTLINNNTYTSPAKTAYYMISTSLWETLLHPCHRMKISP